jgi:hypothetical protein
MAAAFSFVAMVLLVTTPSSCAQTPTPPRIVPLEWKSTITATLNSTVILHGYTYKSAAHQAVHVTHSTNEATLLRTDLLSTFQSSTSTCNCSQLYNSEFLNLLDFLLAPGTVFNGSTTINGRTCDVWVSPFKANTTWGKHVCLESAPRMYMYQRPVRYWLTLPALTFMVDFENDFTAAGVIPNRVFDIPKNCPQPNNTEHLPVGLADSFEESQVQRFWMPPLKKYYTYMPGHITVEKGLARVGSQAARVNVQPGDVRNAGTERDELDIPMLLLGERELYYSWSFLLSKDFGFSSNRIVLGQWKQSSLFTQSPVIALRLKNKKLVFSIRNVTLELSDDDEIMFDLVETMQLGKWYDVKFGILFSHGNDGFVRVWINGTESGFYQGPTMSMADPGYFDFHFGVYRDGIRKNQTLLLDNFQVTGNTSNKSIPPVLQPRNHAQRET